jgi:hypothetical protein
MVDAAEKAIAQLRPDTIIMAASWTGYYLPRSNVDSVTGVSATIKRLREIGIKHIVVIGPVERWDAPLPEIILAEMRATNRWGNAPERILGHLQKGPETLDPKLRAATVAAGARYISALNTLCNAQGCLVSVGPEDTPSPYSFEYDHFTVEGCVDFIGRIWQDIALEIPGS